jgi:hypothetical protein
VIDESWRFNYGCRAESWSGNNSADFGFDFEYQNGNNFLIGKDGDLDLTILEVYEVI